MSILAPGKFRTLSTVDKKQISLLRSIVDEVGKEVALRTNNLDALFATVRGIAKEIPPSESDDLYSIRADSIAKLQDIIDRQEKAFRDDDMEIYNYELDEDLLLPIAHECLTLWNRVEGFETSAYVPPSEEVRQRKKARVEQAKAKKEQAAEKQREEKLERAKEREAERLKKDELRKSILSPFHDIVTVDDATIANPRALGFIDYSGVPLNDPKEFSRALEVWTFLVSIPQVLTLQQFSLSMFLSSLQDDKETFLIQEACRMLVQVGAKGSPLVKMPVKTAGRNWFDQVREYLAVASGAKQQRKEALEQKRILAEKQKESANIDDGGVDGKDSDDDDAGNQSVEEGEEEEDVDFATDFADMMKAMDAMKGRVGWGNLEIHDRLVLLKFLVDSLLQAPNVIKGADAVTASDAAEQLVFERAVKDQRDEFEKELRAAAKRKLEGEDAVADAREGALGNLKAGVEAAFSKRMDIAEKQDVGVRILPIGEDRYGRLYWRFPLDSNVYVQTVGTSKAFPIVSRPKVAFLDDDEDAGGIGKAPAVGDVSASQNVWGYIAPGDLEGFISTLESRGIRENALKSELERLVPHVTSLSVPNDTVRITRSRATNRGYVNRLNLTSLPY